MLKQYLKAFLKKQVFDTKYIFPKSPIIFFFNKIRNINVKPKGKYSCKLWEYEFIIKKFNWLIFSSYQIYSEMSIPIKVIMLGKLLLFQK